MHKKLPVFLKEVSIHFWDQSFIDEFPIHFSNCTTINPEVKIGMDEDIHDLTPLSTIKKIVGELTVAGTSLTNLSGLENLEGASSLAIGSMPLLTSIEALANFKPTSPGNFNLEIAENPLLSSLQGLEGISKRSTDSANRHFYFTGTEQSD